MLINGSVRYRTSQGWTGRFRDAFSALNAAQKPGMGVPAYTRWVNRRLGRYAAAAAYALRWTPNAVQTPTMDL